MRLLHAHPRRQLDYRYHARWTSSYHRTRRSTLFVVRWSRATLRCSKPKPLYVLIKSNSQECHRPTIIPVEQEVSLVTLLLCRPCYYHIGLPADQGYAEHMRAMFGRDDIDPPRQEPPRQEQQSMGSSSRGSSSHYSLPNLGWQSRLGQSVPAFPGSRIIPTRRVDPRDASMQIWLTRRSIG